MDPQLPPQPTTQPPPPDIPGEQLPPLAAAAPPPAPPQLEAIPQQPTPEPGPEPVAPPQPVAPPVPPPPTEIKVKLPDFKDAPAGPSFYGYKPPTWANDFEHVRINKGKGKDSDAATWLLYMVDRLLKKHS